MTTRASRYGVRLLAVAVLLTCLVAPRFDGAVRAQGATAGTIDVTAGLRVYNANCLACHQASGDGIPGVFPPLRGHVSEVLAAEGGREYLVSAVLFGLAGRIEVAGRSYDGLMPSWGHLGDAQLAAVLSYVATAWAGPHDLSRDDLVFTPEEVLAARAAALDGAGVRRLRDGLGLGQ